MISTWNRCRRLEETLDALTRCAVPVGSRWELVVVNNNSTDRTAEVCEAFCGKLPLVYVEEPVQGLSVARNAGLRAASGRLIVFTDDDSIPSRDWLTIYLSAFRDRPQGFFFAGPVRSVFDQCEIDPELLSVASASVRGCDHGPADGPLERAQHVLEVNWACPADAISAVGGYDARWGLNPERGGVRTSEGIDLRNRLRDAGMRGWYLADARVDHLVTAEKCTLGHIGDYRQAQGFYCAATGEYSSYSGDRAPLPQAGLLERGPAVAGVPLWLGTRLLANEMRGAWREIRGETAYRERVWSRFYIGMAKGFRFRARQPNRRATPIPS